MSTERVEPLGDRAVRFARPAMSARALVRAARAWPGVVDVVVAREDVAVYFERESPDLASVAARVRELAAAGADTDTPGREHVLDVIYDGADLEVVARASGLSVADVIARHQTATYTVETMGFVPGFAYLDGLDPTLELPRRAPPRERVAANSVGIAGRQTAVYPLDSAGGWHLIGRVVGVRMFGEHGALLALGDRVRFRA